MHTKRWLPQVLALQTACPQVPSINFNLRHLSLFFSLLPLHAPIKMDRSKVRLLPLLPLMPLISPSSPLSLVPLISLISLSPPLPLISPIFLLSLLPPISLISVILTFVL